MHRALARAALSAGSSASKTLRTKPSRASNPSSSLAGACRCYSDSPTDPTPTYSLPHDAFDSTHPSSSASDAVPLSRPGPSRAPLSPPTQPPARRRQRQTLSNAEAQAFADLLGEIMPRTAQPASTPSSSTGGTDADAGGLFGIFAPAGGVASVADSAATAGRGGAGGAASLDASVSKVQQALMRKVGYKMGMQLDPSGSGKWARKARTELTEQEELELDRLREELMGLKSDYQVLKWGLERVFGFDKGYVAETMYPDANLLPVGAGVVEQQQPGDNSTTTTKYGPLSRMYPDLLLLLFLVLRDTHRNPTLALSLFRLAKSNPFSYINGCTTSLYLEVLRTYWSDGAGDIEAVLGGLDEMRANGVMFDEKVRELVRSIGEAIRIDQERAELRYEREIVPNNGADAHVVSAIERERQILRRRWFDANQVGAWSRMERIVEENQDELEDARRAREDERWHDSERARRDRFEVEREQAQRERPDLISRAGSSSLWSGGMGAGESAPPPRRRRSSLSSGADGVDLLGSSSARPTWETWSVPKAERDEDGNFVLPKRPSFVNPFKIRRRGLSKEEKARKDTRHPALWWKK